MTLISDTVAGSLMARGEIDLVVGFVEETGVAQHFRDARIAPIYEGTNGIQAMDLVGRQMVDGGDAAFR